MAKILIIMGSAKDLDYAKKIQKVIEKFKIKCELRIASAHKTPNKILEILKENANEEVIYITIAGRSNALSGFVDSNTTKPVIAAPPYSEQFGGVDIYSSLRMPSGVAPLVVLGFEQAALGAVKILGLRDEILQKKILEYQNVYKKNIEEEDKKING